MLQDQIDLIEAAGLCFMVIGIGIFILKKTEGRNTIKVLGSEISLSTPSLVVFIVGALLLVFPSSQYYSPIPQDDNRAPKTPRESRKSIDDLNSDVLPENKITKVDDVEKGSLPANVPQPQRTGTSKPGLRNPDKNLSTRSSRVPREVSIHQCGEIRSVTPELVKTFVGQHSEFERLSDTDGIYYTNKASLDENYILYYVPADKAMAEAFATALGEVAKTKIVTYTEYRTPQSDEDRWADNFSAGALAVVLVGRGCSIQS